MSDFEISDFFYAVIPYFLLTHLSPNFRYSMLIFFTGTRPYHL